MNLLLFQKKRLSKGIRLALDFMGGNLDSRISFSRGSNATVVGSNGLIQYAPHNLLTYSEQFDHAAWTKNNTTVSANVEIAPDGTLTADKLEPATTASTSIYQSVVIAASSYTGSVYVKKGSGASDANRFYLRDITTATTLLQVVIDYDTLVITYIVGSTGASVQNVGNGWLRVSLTITSSLTIGNTLRYGVCFVGNETAGEFAYVWGAQLNEGALQPYYSTTVKNLLGYSQNFENAAWAKSSSSVLYNLESYSQQFSNAFWNKAGGLTTVTDNFTTAPDGTTTATKWTEAAGTGSHHIHDLVGSYTPVIGLPYTMSMYLKQTETNPDRYVQMTFWLAGFSATAYANFDMQTGTVAFQGANITNATITAVGSGWYRLSITSLATATGASGWQAAFVSSGTAPRTESYTVTAGNEESYYLWGAQVVASPSAENYTVTTSASAPIRAIGPFGFNGGEKLVENTANILHYVAQTQSTSANSVLTLSVYAKAGERTQVDVRVGGVGWATSPVCVVNLITGAIVSGSGATVVPVGDGWFRISLTAIADGTTQARGIVVAPAVAGNSTYTGDGTSGIYIFGAQLSDSASLDPYSYNPVAAPTSTAYYGPRFDYDPATLAPKGLLIEEQRTNLVLNSDTISTQSVTVTAQAYTLSFYGTGTITLSGTSTGSLVGTGAYPNRVSLTFTPTAGTLTLTVTGSVRYAQLEAGAFPTSYIPTTSATVTRAADNASMVGSNFSSWYNQSEGTIYSQWMLGRDNISANVYNINDTTATNYIRNRYGSAGTANDNAVTVSSVIQQTLTATNQVALYAMYKNAMAYKQNDFARSANGTLITGSTGNIPVVSQMNIGGIVGDYLNGHIQSIKYYPTRLPNADLQRLTR
jgi:hypothetical protein